MWSGENRNENISTESPDGETFRYCKRRYHQGYRLNDNILQETTVFLDKVEMI